MKNVPQISEELILAVQEALMNQTKVETISPIVNAYQREILAEKQYEVVEEWKERCGSEPIVDPRDSYLMSDQDSAEYYELLRLKHIENGFGDLEDTRCPLLIAEDELRQSRRKVFALAEYLHNIPQSRYVPMDKEKKMIELIISMVVAYCKENKIDLNPKLEVN